MKEDIFISHGDMSYRLLSMNHASESTSVDFCHECFEIIYFVCADCNVTIEGMTYHIRSGSLALINPFTFYKLELAGGDFSAASLLFTRLSLAENISNMLGDILGENDNSGKFFSPDEVSGVKGVFARFSTAASLPEEQKKAYIGALLSELIILLSVAGGDSIVHRNNCLGARVVRYLNQNIEKNVSLDKLAKHFFVSKYHLCRAFKEYCGISVHSYINYKRIIYARRLIESGETASGAAEKVGFGDYSAFYRAYVKILGKSPTAN